jgi:hypothetical protein
MARGFGAMDADASTALWKRDIHPNTRGNFSFDTTWDGMSRLVANSSGHIAVLH